MRHLHRPQAIREDTEAANFPRTDGIQRGPTQVRPGVTLLDQKVAFVIQMDQKDAFDGTIQFTGAWNA